MVTQGQTGKRGSVLFGQEHGGEATIPFGENPDGFAAVGQGIGREQPVAKEERLAVDFTIFGAQVAPIAALMAIEQIFGFHHGIAQGFQSARRGDDLAQIKKRWQARG